VHTKREEQQLEELALIAKKAGVQLQDFSSKPKKSADLATFSQDEPVAVADGAAQAQQTVVFSGEHEESEEEVTVNVTTEPIEGLFTSLDNERPAEKGRSYKKSGSGGGAATGRRKPATTTTEKKKTKRKWNKKKLRNFKANGQRKKNK